MSDSIRKQAEAAQNDIEGLSNRPLPEPSDAEAVTTLEAADAPKGAEITRRVAELDMSDSNSIVGFGAAAQSELQEISQSMLAGVRNKDVGPAGDSLRGIVTTIRGFSVAELDLRRERSWWERLLGRAAPVANFAARFEEVQTQIDRITEDLLSHEHKLLKDIRASTISTRRPSRSMTNWRSTSRPAMKSSNSSTPPIFPLSDPPSRPRRKAKG